MMTKSTTQTYKLLPQWTLRQVKTSLIISGGADARYEIELENDKPSFFSTLKSTRAFTRNELSVSDERVLEELITAEIVVPILAHAKDVQIAVLGDRGHLKINAQNNTGAPDLAVVVRVQSTYSELLKKLDYPNLNLPHLFVDLAFHHTLSIGPLVFPGETACIACLQGRIGTRWGDEKPPAQPRVANQYRAVAPELIKTELDRIKAGDTSLTNKTVSWNFKDRAVKLNQLLKVPLCPICTQNKIDRSGALALP